MHDWDRTKAVRLRHVHVDPAAAFNELQLPSRTGYLRLSFIPRLNTTLLHHTFRYWHDKMGESAFSMPWHYRAAD